MVSHELRVPLTSIKGSAITALLDDSSGLNPAERQFLRIIVNQTDHMGELIDDLLDVALIETGTLPVSPEPAETATLVDRARNTFLSSGEKNDLDLDLAPDSALGHGRPTAHRPGPGKPPVQRGKVLAGIVHHPGDRRAERFPRGGHRRRRGHSGYPPSGCRTCSGSFPAPTARTEGNAEPAVRVLALPSARGSWRRTVAASGLKATGLGQGARFTFTIPDSRRYRKQRTQPSLARLHHPLAAEGE